MQLPFNAVDWLSPRGLENREMYQAITTKYLGPTNTRGSRFKASCEAASITMNLDDRFDIPENHKFAAILLTQKLGWDDESRYGEWHGGATKDGYVFVRVNGGLTKV